MRILISGAAGFLGSHLCDRFVKDGHDVVALDNFITGREINLADVIENKHFKLIRHDVATTINLDEKFDAILHFASPASPNPNSPYGYPQLAIQTMKAGALGTHNMLGVARKDNAIFLLASTSEIYGDPLEHPQKETYWGHVDPVGPRSVYDEAKRFAESLTMAYHRVHQIDTRIARIFNTYGPRMRLDDGRVVPNFIQLALEKKPLTIYGDGKQTRSFCYVSDMVEGIFQLFSSHENLPVNLGNPVEISINRFAEIINVMTSNKAGVIHKEGMFVGHDPQRRQPDISKAKKLLGWEPTISLEAGIERTIHYYKNYSK
jgi:dTDP-glucose 4,6-dehydratase